MDWNKEEIKILRRRLGWTQSDLARRLQISVHTIDLWEEGSHLPESFQIQELELLDHQASLCSDEVRALPAAETECQASKMGQVDFSRVKGELQ